MKMNRNLILTVLITTVLIAAALHQFFVKSSSAAPQLRITNTTSNNTSNIRPSLQTDFNPNVTSPSISKSAYINPFAVIIGDCQIGKLDLVAPFAVCRG